jgi:hypothetical protein
MSLFGLLILNLRLSEVIVERYFTADFCLLCSSLIREVFSFAARFARLAGRD